MANNINLNMAEVLCRKRTETAVIYWIVFKFNQLNAFKNNAYGNWYSKSM